jgi:hypothetical protein
VSSSLALTLLNTIECTSPGKRNWPEDMTWHLDGNRLFATCSAHEGDHQVSIINMNASDRNMNFLEDKSHIKDILNSIVFRPWDDTHFATGGINSIAFMPSSLTKITIFNHYLFHSP